MAGPLTTASRVTANVPASAALTLAKGRGPALSRAAPETSAFPAMQHWPAFAEAAPGTPVLGAVGAPQTALCGLSLGSGWAAAAHFDATQPSRKPPLRAKTSPFAGALAMEPTGIEPVTSCLQNDTANLPYGPIFLRLCEIATLAPRRGYGGIRRDQAGFGQRNRAAAQRGAELGLDSC